MFDVRVGSGFAPVFIRVHGRVERIQLQIGIAKPVAELSDLRGVAPVEMLLRAENFDRLDARAFDAAEPGSGQAMIDDDVRGKGAIHSYRVVERRSRLDCKGSVEAFPIDTGMLILRPSRLAAPESDAVYSLRVQRRGRILLRIPGGSTPDPVGVVPEGLRMPKLG